MTVYILLWFLGLSGTLSLVAASLAHAGRLRTRSHQTTGPTLVAALLLVLPAAVVAGGASYFLESGRPSLLVYALAWLLAYLVGTLLLFRSGWRGLQSEPSAPCSRRWPTRRLAAAATVAFALMLVLLAWLDRTTTSQLAALLEESERVVSLHAPRAEAERNAAPIYRQAFAAMGPLDEWPAWIENVIEKDFDCSTRQVEEFLAEKRDAVDLLHAAASRPECALGLDYRAVAGSQLYPELLWFRNACRLLVLTARLRAAQGSARSLEALGALDGIVRHVAAEPLVISLLFASGLAEERARAVAAVLTGAPALPPDAIPRRGEPRISFASRVEVCLRVDEALTVDSLVRQKTAAGWAARTFFLPFEIAALRQGFSELHALDAADRHEAGPPLRSLFAGSGVIGKVYLPALAEVSVLAARGDAWTRLADLALAAVTFRRRHGHYPGNAADLERGLGVSLAADPFDGGPLKTRKGPEGIVLYSVGEDGRDDGGLPAREPGAPGDLVLELVGK